jgi:aspartate aminotransferase
MGEELCRRLLEDTGVALLPGSAFGRPEQELTARMAFVDFDGARALAAAEQMALDKEIDETFLREYCGKVLTAVELLTAWSAELC